MVFGLPGPRAGRPGVQGSPGGSGVSSVGFPFFSSTICRWSNPKSFQKLMFGCSSDSSRGFEARDPKHHPQNKLFSTSAGLGIIKGLSNPAQNPYSPPGEVTCTAPAAGIEGLAGLSNFEPQLGLMIHTSTQRFSSPPGGFKGSAPDNISMRLWNSISNNYKHVGKSFLRNADAGFCDPTESVTIIQHS